VDAAVWLSLSDLKNIFSNKTTKIKFELELFKPPYPNKLLGGISKAHNCALRYFLKS
jgi:hypothetical protein